MITISVFADEIGPDLDLQIETCLAQGVRHIDVRGIANKSVSSFTLEEAQAYQRRLSERGITVPCIGSPLGKIRMDEDFDAHLDLLKHTCDVAHAFNTTLIRVFSFYPSKGARIEEERAGVMERMAAMLAVAEQAGAILLHENESGIYGATPTGVKDLFATLPSDRLQGCFDPSNYVTEGFAPYDDGWKQGLDRLTHYFHVKDKVPGENTSVPAGEGAGQFPEILAELKARNWSGVMTLEPHLNPANERYAGLSGAERFVLAVQGLRRVLDAAGLAWQ